MLGFSSREEAFEHNLRDLCVEPQEHDADYRTLRQRGQLASHETRLRRCDGKIITVLSTATLVPGKQDGPPLVQGTSLDVTEIRHLQQAFLQAQKMEAVGRLAGGVAHDFNNLLMVISSYSELLLESLTQERQRRHAEQIQKAALRATDLTGQLLAFSRKQTTAPRVLNLNSVVRDIEKMLLRLIGEDICLETALDEALAPCRVDVTQVQQIILNLVVNARDAMPGGGRLLIETANVELDEVRAFLYHQGSRKRDGAGIVDRLWHRQAEWRFRFGVQRTRPWGHLQSLSAQSGGGRSGKQPGTGGCSAGRRGFGHHSSGRRRTRSAGSCG
jgi:PAS domain S-box-containing protein